MPSIYQLKPAFQDLLRPAARLLVRAGISANQVTVFAAALSVACGAALFFYSQWRWPLLLVPGLLFVRMALNALDGMLAREFGQKSDLGAFLNELGDVIADSAIYLGFAPLLPLWPLFFFTLLAMLTEFAGLVALQTGRLRRYDGPLGKSDRAFLFGLLALLLYFLGALPYLNWALWIACLLLLITVVQRVRLALQAPTPGAATQA
ncbi:MAG: CDP-alcohol phosphatidyltransferase family protein [Leptospirales bacterium]|nr:CDP-alcohol phosphatidyltransferase family protein [Leptospirales bacterium]